MGCRETTTEPVPIASENLFILNSTGQTLQGFSVTEVLSSGNPGVDLGAGFDGDAFDLNSRHAVTTVSSFGGSRVLFVELSTGEVTASTFPEPEGDLANPSAPYLESDGTAWTGGRGSDAVYRVRPGEAEAVRLAEDVGSFIERVVPVGARLYVVDANLDDDGGTYLARGPGRIVVLSRSGEREQELDLPASVLNPADAVEVEGKLIVLGGGTFDPTTFLPALDGALISLDIATGGLSAPLPLSANGVSLELGGDGYVYVTTTTDYETWSVLRYDAATGAFVHGPESPIPVRDAAGEPVDCWTATGLADGRLLCATFSFEQAGRLLLLDGSGAFLDESVGGFGTTDIALAEGQ
jgi:outer membrane protein assembly factor BamB